MHIELTEEQCAELQQLLEGSLGDMSTEIAATDNFEYRDGLRNRRNVLESILYLLDNPPRGASDRGRELPAAGCSQASVPSPAAVPPLSPPAALMSRMLRPVRV